jgi:polyferredoxin
MKRSIIRNTNKANGQTIRFWIQMAFMLLCVWIGVEFVLWVKFHQGTGVVAPGRPAGVEGFLPISALMSLRLLFLNGELHGVHPAGTMILVAIIAVSLIFKKSFCSWFCPVGTISESVAEFGRRIFKRNFLPWKWLDVALRSLKYLLLAFFAYVIFLVMDAASLRLFLDSPYNRVADVKMLLFFEEITRTSIIVLAVLVVASVFIRNFWCRYLCPYGALLGIVGVLSPFRITRNASTCIDCAKCAKACPAAIKVDQVARVLSDECTSCMACVDACPVAATLELKMSRRARFAVRPAQVAAGITLLFMAITGAAMLAGRWQTSISESEFNARINDIRNPLYQHHYGQAPAEDGADMGGGWETTKP